MQNQTTTYTKKDGAYFSDDGKYRIERGSRWMVFEIGAGFLSSARSLREAKWVVENRKNSPPVKYMDYWGESYS